MIDMRPEFKIGSIHCPECGKYIFDNERVCPFCGYDIKTRIEEEDRIIIKEPTQVIPICFMQSPKVQLESKPNAIYQKPIPKQKQESYDDIMKLDSRFTQFHTSDDQIRNYWKKVNAWSNKDNQK